MKQEELRKARKKEEQAALLEKKRQRQAQQDELERIRQQQENEQRAAEQQPKGFGSFTSADSAFVEPKGFEQFGADARYRPKSIYADREMNGGFGANLPRGFGSFGKDDPPPRGVAGFGGSTTQEDSGSAAREPEEAPFRGKPFAPRDIRRAAASGDVPSLKDYIEQRPTWVDRKDKNEWGALHLAIKGAHQEAVETLLAAGAEVNGRTSQGQTPLGLAVDRTGDQSPISNLLRQYGGEL